MTVLLGPFKPVLGGKRNVLPGFWTTACRLATSSSGATCWENKEMPMIRTTWIVDYVNERWRGDRDREIWGSRGLEKDGEIHGGNGTRSMLSRSHGH